MKLLTPFLFMGILQTGISQVTLKADGPGDTYELITSVLAPGENPIEAPDCNHMDFGEHIDEIFDADLNSNVFRFYIHTSLDNDRCINLDRQRNEIKTYDKSPENLKGRVNEKVQYKWKFKLAAGFQSSSNFTHIHQLKSVGGDLASKPMYTLTTREGSPDQLELRYAETDSQITLDKTDIEPFIGEWLEVTETVKYGDAGSYEIKINRISDGTTLFDYSNDSIINWREGADFVRPKWGIYRSLLSAEDLRDETVLFADFSIEELESSAIESVESLEDEIIFSNPVSHTIDIRKIPTDTESIQLTDLQGNRILTEATNSKSFYQLDVSEVVNGTYILTIYGADYTKSNFVFILNE